MKKMYPPQWQKGGSLPGSRDAVYGLERLFWSRPHAHCLDSCVVEVGRGVVFVPVCTAALMAGLNLLRMRKDTLSLEQQPKSLPAPGLPFQGPHIFGTTSNIVHHGAITVLLLLIIFSCFPPF